MQYIAGISISLFLVALLLNKRKKANSDIILLIWMLLNALHLSLQYTNVNGIMAENPNLYGLVAPLPLLHGVSLYLYVASVTNQFPTKPWKVCIHFIPAVLAYTYLLLFYFFLPTAEKITLFENEGAGHELFLGTLFISTAISGVAYIIWSIFLLRNHRKNILQRFSEIENVNLKWLQFLIYGLAIVWCMVIFTQKDEFIYAAVVVFVILTGFFGIQQIDIFQNRNVQADPASENENENKTDQTKYASSGLTEDRSQVLYEKLKILLEEDEVYKQQELSVGELAEKLDTHPNYLSQVINEKTGKSFYDLINTYRVEDFKKLVIDPVSKQFTMLSLAYECGFNSKSSFNRYFKKATGLTPTQYIKEQK